MHEKQFPFLSHFYANRFKKVKKKMTTKKVCKYKKKRI